MKFTAKVRRVGDVDWWIEKYDIPHINTIEDAREYLGQIISDWNCRNDDRPREYCDVIMVGPSEKHDWRKTNIMTIVPVDGGNHDRYQCSVCGVTGKRYGICDWITRDKPYSSKKFESCLYSQKYMRE